MRHVLGAHNAKTATTRETNPRRSVARIRESIRTKKDLGSILGAPAEMRCGGDGLPTRAMILGYPDREIYVRHAGSPPGTGYVLMSCVFPDGGQGEEFRPGGVIPKARKASAQ